MQAIIKKSLSLALVMVLALTAFGLTTQTAHAVTAPTSLTLAVESGSGYSAVVDIYGKVKVYVKSAYPSTASKYVTWSVYSGGSYGKISSSSSTYCYVQGLKTGTVTIKAKSKYYPYVTKYIKVYVKQLYPTGLTLSKSAVNLWCATNYTVTATVVKKSWVYAYPLTWKSSNTAVGTVSAGKITASASTVGSSTISATYKEGTKIFNASATLKTFNAKLTNSPRVSLDKGNTLTNPVIVTGPAGTTLSYTTAYASNAAAATVNATSGLVTGATDGSATLTATVNMPSITATTKTKALSYYVNVRTPGADTFTLPTTWTRLEINDTGEGYGGAKTLVLTKSMLDDFFGIGSLGIDLFNPMDVELNFMAANLNWNAGGFVFTKTGVSAEVSAMKDGLYWYSPYYLYATGTANESVDVLTDVDGNPTGYDLNFYHSATDAAAGGATLTLRDNVLTVPFGGEPLAFKRVAYNKVEIYAAADPDGIVDDLVLTIKRTLTGHTFSIENAAYMTEQGISFYTYKTYL